MNWTILQAALKLKCYSPAGPADGDSIRWVMISCVIQFPLCRVLMNRHAVCEAQFGKTMYGLIP